MPIDASVYGQFAPRVQSPADVQNALSQSAQNALAMQQMQADMADTNALRAAYRAGADPTTPEGRQTLIQAAPLQAPKIFQQQADLAAKQAEAKMFGAHANEFLASAAGKKLDQARSVLPMVQTPDQMAGWIKGLYADPDVGPMVQQQFGPVDQAVARIPQDPAQFQQFVKMNAMGMDKFIQNQTAVRGQDLTAATSRANNADTNATHVQTTGMTNATTLKATSMREGGENARAAESRAAQFKLAGLNPDGTSATGDADREKQLDYWSEVIRNGGSLPPGLARGRDGSAFVRAVTQRAAMGPTSPADLMANQAEFVGAKAGQRTLGNRQANIEMAASEAYNMIPIAVDASNKVSRTQFPNLNSVLLAAQKGTGDENVVKLATATNSLVNSYSRAISPTGVPTVSDKDHAREILDKAFSQGQFKAATDMMAKEIEAARKSPVQVREHMRPGAPSETPPNVVNFSDLK